MSEVAGPQAMTRRVCVACGEARPDFCFDGEVCTTCRVDQERAGDTDRLVDFVTDPTWAGRRGAAIRDQRNRLLDHWAWTLRPGSPLSPACQAAFVAFFDALNRLTVDFARPDDVTWPEIPALEYGEI